MTFRPLLQLRGTTPCWSASVASSVPPPARCLDGRGWKPLERCIALLLEEERNGGCGQQKASSTPGRPRLSPSTMETRIDNCFRDLTKTPLRFQELYYKRAPTTSPLDQQRCAAGWKRSFWRWPEPASIGTPYPTLQSMPLPARPTPGAAAGTPVDLLRKTLEPHAPTTLTPLLRR